MAVNTNIKVGVTVTAFSTLVLGALLWLSNFDPSKKVYSLQGNFTNVGGLIPGSKVYLMGVQIGQVTATIPDLNKVKVLMEIDDKVKIPTNTRLTIAAKGLVGDKSIEFFLNDDSIPKSFYPPNTELNGNSPASFEDLIIEGKKVMQKANALINDPELNKDIKLISRNARLTSGNIEVFTKKLDTTISEIDKAIVDMSKISGTAQDLIGNTSKAVNQINDFVTEIKKATTFNRGNIDSIITNADGIVKSLNHTANTLEQLVDNPNNRTDIKNTVDSIKRAALNIQKISYDATVISSDIRNVTGDKDLKENLKSIVENTKLISGTFANTIALPNQDKKKEEKNERERLHIDFRSEVLGKVNYQFNTSNPPTFEVIGNFNMLAHTGFPTFPFVQLGIEEIGSRNQLNVQAGFYPFDNLRVRLGIVKSKLGVGSNYFVEKTNTEIIGEFYDIGSPHLRLGILQNIYNDYGLSLYVDSQFMTNTNEIGLGFRWEPGIF